MDDKGCPIQLLANVVAGKGNEQSDGSCTDFCQWYDTENDTCIVVTLSRQINEIQSILRSQRLIR